MNITEANDTNTLIRAVMQAKISPRKVDWYAVREAARRLADRANKALSAGLRAEDIDKEWPA